MPFLKWGIRDATTSSIPFSEDGCRLPVLGTKKMLTRPYGPEHLRASVCRPTISVTSAAANVPQSVQGESVDKKDRKGGTGVQDEKQDDGGRGKTPLLLKPADISLVNTRSIRCSPVQPSPTGKCLMLMVLK